MTKSRKILLISLLPALLTLVFIIYALAPAINGLIKAKDDLKAETLAFNETQDKVSVLKKNKRLLNEIEKLQTKLGDFDIKIPTEDELAILLVDIGKFSQQFNVRVYSLDSSSEKTVEISGSDQDNSKSRKKAKRRSKNNENEEKPLVSLLRIPLEIMIVGYYSDVLGFIQSVESYQRQVTIDGVTVANSKDDKNSQMPRVEMSINCAVYKLVRNDIIPEKQKEEKPQ